MREPYPLFKGASRTPTFLGVPAFPLMWMTIVVFGLSINVSMWLAVLWPIAWGVMFGITKHDDKAFRILGLWLATTVRNRACDLVRGSRNFKRWGGSSYAPTNHQRRR